MSPKISEEQSKELFVFCHKHFVYHYDLQVELVDHLASSIEEQWEENPQISFQEALTKTFKKFGVTGFSKIKEQKRKELSRKYSRLLWKYLLEFYSWPKILLTIAITLALVTVFQLVQSVAYIVVPYFLLLVISGIIYVYKFAPKNFKLDVVPGKKFLLLEQLRQYHFAGLLLCQLPINMYNITRYIDVNFIEYYWLLFSLALLTVSLTIIFLGSLFYIPQKIKEHFFEEYAEFAL